MFLLGARLNLKWLHSCSTLFTSVGSGRGEVLEEAPAHRTLPTYSSCLSSHNVHKQRAGFTVVLCLRSLQSGIHITYQHNLLRRGPPVLFPQLAVSYQHTHRHTLTAGAVEQDAGGQADRWCADNAVSLEQRTKALRAGQQIHLVESAGRT